MIIIMNKCKVYFMCEGMHLITQCTIKLKTYQIKAKTNFVVYLDTRQKPQSFHQSRNEKMKLIKLIRLYISG